MPVLTDHISAAHQEQTRKMLHELRFPIHRNGYKQLCVAVPLFALDPFQNLNKELYPSVAMFLDCSDGRAVERSIRDTILAAWADRDPDVWAQYFPDTSKAPSNKLFLSVLSERLV